MRIEFSYQNNGEIKQCKFSSPERIEERDQQYRKKFIVRMMIKYIYDHDIEKEDWIEGYIYDKDVCLGKINYVGNFLEKENQ